MALKRTKLLSNVNNCLAAVGGLDAAQQRWLDGQLRAEAVACYAAAGLAYHTSFDSIRARRPDVRLMRRGAIDRDESLRGGSSTWQSLARGTGNIEVDFLVSEILCEVAARPKKPHVTSDLDVGWLVAYRTGRSAC
jgi:2-dehydropantoate 2-reductase